MKRAQSWGVASFRSDAAGAWLDPQAADPSASLKLMNETGRVVSPLSEDRDGRLYLIDWAGGEILRIDPK